MPEKLPLKQVIPIDDQISHLQEKGLVFEDIEFAKNYIKNNGCYHLKIYSDKFKPEGSATLTHGTTFDTLVRCHENDRWFRIQIFSIIEPIEVRLRAFITEHLGKNYGSGALYNKDNFENPKCISYIEKYLQREDESFKDDPIVKNQLQKYGKFHVWAAMEFLPLGMIASLYSGLKMQDRVILSDQINGVSEHYLKSWLKVLSILRNNCAHHSYLFRRIYLKTPLMVKQFEWDPTQNKKLFVLFLVMKQISEKAPFEKRLKVISARDKADPFLNFSDYGFPDDWRSRLSDSL